MHPSEIGDLVNYERQLQSFMFQVQGVGELPCLGSDAPHQCKTSLSIQTDLSKVRFMYI